MAFACFFFVLSSQVFCANNAQVRKEEIVARYGKEKPAAWGEALPGIKTKLDTPEKVLALTFDACGSSTDGYDAELIDFLVKENIPATLFITGRWIDKFPAEFKELSKQPLFEIENHGLNHRPCSVSGRPAYGIKGTRNAGEVFDEVELNALKIEKITGRKPKYFRSGTAYYDDAALKVIRDLGYEAAGFRVNGDHGATASKVEISRELLNAAPGSIVIMHMNRPGRGTFEGLKEVLPRLREKGIKFVKLEDYKLK